MQVSIVVPTLNPGTYAKELLEALRIQDFQRFELIVVDSESSDSGPSMFAEFGAHVLSIDRRQFGHGSARNVGASIARGEFIVFLTQDAIPADRRLISNLVKGVVGRGAAGYGRQIPRATATPLERFARRYNYPSSEDRNQRNSRYSKSIRRVFFSNSCSIVDRSIFEKVGGFPTHTIMNEDMVFASTLQSLGHAISYIPDAIVVHSHAYSLDQTFRRYFDIGVVLEQAREELGGVSLNEEGIKYVRALFNTLWQEHDYTWIPAAFAEITAKWVGTFLGRRHRHLPFSVVKRLSMHKSYWDRSH